jgi:hypothetical protein
MQTSGNDQRAQRQRVSRGGMLWSICAIGMTFLILEACQKVETMNASKSIVVEHALLITEIAGAAKAIARMPNGGYIVAGVRGTAWAVATNADGTFLWKFEDIPDTTIKTPFQSEFNGVVQLSNGNLLLCGSKDTKQGRLGLITILDSRSQIVEQRVLFPKEDRRFFSSSFSHCLRWDGGIVVVGTATNADNGYTWLLKLDSVGTKKWEILDQNLPNGYAVELLDHSLVLSGFDIEVFETRLARVNPVGEVKARRAIKSFADLQLNSIEPTNVSRIITYGVGNKPTLYVLNEDLEDIEKPIDMGEFDAKQGSGFVLKDNSIALFGTLGRPAMALVNARGQPVAQHVFNQTFTAPTVATMPLSEDEFLTVGGTNTPNINEQGLLVSWVMLK